VEKETSCPSCHGTGSILGPYDPRPGQPAHPYEIVCGCGIFPERYPALNYQTGQTMPWTTHRQVLARADGYVAWVDELLREDIERLWQAGIATFSSCQDNYGKFISIRDKTHVDAARDLLPWMTAVEDTAVGSGAVLCERVRGSEDED
jgi:hypothetical protein